MPAFFFPGNQALMHPQEVCVLKEATPAGCCSHGFWAPGTPVGWEMEESPWFLVLGVFWVFHTALQCRLCPDFSPLYVHRAGRQHVRSLGFVAKA